jgi:putative hemolysin
LESDPSAYNLIEIISNLPFIQIINILVFIGLLVLSALISGSEVAFFSLSPQDIESARESKSKKDSILITLLSKPKKLLATILISNNFINIAIVILSSYLSYNLLNIDMTTISGFLIQVVAVTFLILMFGEVIPKVYANINSLGFARTMSQYILVLEKAFSPLSSILLKSTKIIEQRLGKNKGNISVSHLEHALELTADEETSSDEQKILEGIVTFGNTDATQIMCPRIDMFAISSSMRFDELIPEILDNGYSRIPVYQKDIDNIIGILYIKDLLPHINAGKNFNWKRLIKPVFFIPENKKIDDLLDDFREKKTHLAIVVDEYGGTSGLITLEDVIEEIVGDISDEFDDEDISYSKIDKNKYVFEGKTSLKDFQRVIDIDEDNEFEDIKGESDTLAGLILEIAGYFPKKGEKIKFSYFEFTIEAVDKKRIKQIKVSIEDEGKI